MNTINDPPNNLTWDGQEPKKVIKEYCKLLTLVPKVTDCLMATFIEKFSDRADNSSILDCQEKEVARTIVETILFSLEEFLLVLQQKGTEWVAADKEELKEMVEKDAMEGNYYEIFLLVHLDELLDLYQDFVEYPIRILLDAPKNLQSESTITEKDIYILLSQIHHLRNSISNLSIDGNSLMVKDVNNFVNSVDRMIGITILTC